LQTPTTRSETIESAKPLAGLLALVIPGLGHLWLREPRRAAMILLGIGSLTLGGLLIGGIDVVDRKEDRWWFVGQAGIGPAAWVLNTWNQRLKKSDPPINATRDWFETHEPARTKSLAHSNEIGSLWIVIAGMLNAIAAIDAAWHTTPKHKIARRLEDPS
jgi:uncharacterized protein DUF6677